MMHHSQLPDSSTHEGPGRAKGLSCLDVYDNRVATSKPALRCCLAGCDASSLSPGLTSMFWTRASWSQVQNGST